jgi:predicted metal-dependent phosphoesterase TrpH
VIDLHLHTTASDGRCSPAELVERAAAVGVTIMAATDHDTTAAIAEVTAAARARGIQVVPGIEITAVEDGIDVHMLGYFIDPAHAGLQTFLEAQRENRLTRVKEIAARLASLGYPVDLDAVLSGTGGRPGRALGRPQIAYAMIAAGYVADIREAFDRWLGHGRPAFVPRDGHPAAAVTAIVHDAGGLVSLAHPGRTRIDGRIASMRSGGLDAIEAFHSDHDPATTSRYLRLAGELGCLVTGGSDFHGDPARGFEPGSTSLPREHWERLAAAAPGRG